MKALLLTLSLIASSCFSQAQVAFYFDQPEELSNNFTRVQTRDFTLGFNYSSSPGVGGTSGRLDGPFHQSNTLLYNQPLPLVVNLPLTASTYFAYTNGSGRPNQEVIVAGLVGGLNQGLSRFDGISFLAGGLQISGDLTKVQLFLQSKTSGTVTTINSLSPVFTISDGWYELTSAWTPLNATEFQYSLDMSFHGSDGIQPGLHLAGLTAQIANSEIAANGFAFYGITGLYRLQSVDNISIVPEPSTLALFSGGGLFLALRLFRRARAKT